MAHQKMHSGLQRTCNNRKIANVKNSSTVRKSLKQHSFRTSPNEREESSFVWRSSHHRCAVVRFFALEPDGHWRIVSVPLQCPDHTLHLGSGAQVKMDGLHLVSPSPVGSVKVDQQRAPRGPTTDWSCSVKSPTARSFSGSNIQHQSQNKGFINKASRWNRLPGNSSCQNSFSSSDTSVLFPRGPNATNSSNIYIDISRVDKDVKRNSRKKAKKKGKQSKKLLCDTGSNALECSHGSSTSEIGLSKNMDHGVGPLPHTAILVVPLPECVCNRNDLEVTSNDTYHCSETPETCTSYIDEVEVSEVLGPSVLQNFSGEHPSLNSENGIQTNYPEFSNGVQDMKSEPICCFSNNVFSETNNSLVLDSVSVGSNSDERIAAACNVKILNKDNDEINFASKGCFSCGNMLNGASDLYCHVEGTKYNRQGVTGGSIHLVVPIKRGKQINRVARNPSVYRFSSVGHLHCRSGKENNHSVWREVRRNDADECNYKLKGGKSICSQFNIGLEEAPSLKKNCSVVESNLLSNDGDKSWSKLKVSRKLKRKTSSGPKPKYNCYSRKGSRAIKVNSNMCTKIDMQQNEILVIPAQMCGQKRLSKVSRSHFKINSPVVGFEMDRAESICSDPVESLQVCPGELGPLENVDTIVSSFNDQRAQNQSNLLPISCDYLDQSALLEGKSVVCLHPLVSDEGIDVDKDVSSIQHVKEDHISGSFFQKWIPVGTKDSVLSSSARSNDDLDRSDAESSTLIHIAEVELASVPRALPSSMDARLMCSLQGSGNDNEAWKLKNQSMCTPKEYSINATAEKCLVHESKDQNYSAFENGLDKIAQAVKDAYRAQLTSEALQMASGCPIAEFEKLLHSASPVICLPCGNMNCQTCSHDEVVGVSLGRHEAPCISLGSLWQWYEKHGSYGLEVRAEDYKNSKRLGIDRFAFRAYFVPFLSAVQLFRNRKSHPLRNRNEIPGTEAMVAYKVDETSENSSNSGRLPIFSVLVPQPHTEDTSFLLPRNHGCCSESSSECIKDNISIQRIDSASSDDLELLFEYFEVEQPQQRRPLFEMIKELIRGDGHPQCRAYGDPTTLDSVDLHDLRPESWYSVAWYPIYRIPDGNFRAAFLTYHSLGHLVQTSASSDSFSVDASIVSPVVGLQSYNAQGECWFQPRQSALSQTTENNPNLNPSGILKERLRTLEQTAALMARGVVSKGNLTSVNRQPDYEFFLSRRHS